MVLRGGAFSYEQGTLVGFRVGGLTPDSASHMNVPVPPPVTGMSSFQTPASLRAVLAFSALPATTCGVGD